jgi:ketosteroid isomerase-like protein
MISDLFARYARSIDQYDEAALFACFTEDGVIETPVLGGRFVGREGQREFVRRAQKAGEGRQMRHVITNLEVALHGDKAEARAYLTVTSTTAGVTDIFHAGHYECQLKKQAGEWRFEYRRVFIDGRS